jgi:hypothetical protein
MTAKIDAAWLDETAKGCKDVTLGPWKASPWYVEEGSPVVRFGDHFAFILAVLASDADAAHIARFTPKNALELIRLARIGLDLEEGREVFIRGIRVHAPLSSGDF